MAYPREPSTSLNLRSPSVLSQQESESDCRGVLAGARLERSGSCQAASSLACWRKLSVSATALGQIGETVANFAKPEFSRNQVDRAGFFLIEENTDFRAMIDALRIINNWRSAHAYPLLHFRINLMRLVKAIQPEAIIAQRIKRLESISAKLQRQSTQLSQMQDIGGCRAIFHNIEEVDQLVKAYERSKSAHELRSQKDYIASPKRDGYRSRHLIFSYKSARGQKSEYDRLRIEVQIRTSLQHAWATAVEAVGIFTRQALKSNIGDEKWLRLFALMSSQIAAIENTPPVPGTPDVESVRLDEIRLLATSLRAVQLLDAYRVTINYIGQKDVIGAKYYLIDFDYEKNNVNIQAFDNISSQKANTAYTAAETGIDASKKNVVLVSVDSINNLQKAYPNYFLDTAHFSRMLKDCIFNSAKALDA